MKSARKISKSPLMIVAALIFGVGFAFQNCAKVQFAALDASSKVDNLGNPIEKNYAEATVGDAQVPPLKLVFVVDNSYSMLASQVNLSASFSKLFDEQVNASNLTKFDTTAFLLNTAQNTPARDSSDLSKLANAQMEQSALPALSMATVMNDHRGQVVSGKIAGDDLGYWVLKNSVGHNFMPAPFLGVEANGSGSSWFKGIHKAANVDASDMADEFKSRLEYFNGLRTPRMVEQISDSESGLCAMARVLLDPDGFLRNDELAAFIVTTDEDDSDISGEKCIRGYSKFTGNEDLVDGYCENRETTFTYDRTRAGCNLQYKESYKVDYSQSYPTLAVTYNTSTTSADQTDIVYKKITAYSYSAPQYKVSSYSKIASQKIKRTKVVYRIKSCPVFDGIEVAEQCTYPAATNYVTGDYTSASACASAAAGINSQAITSGANGPVCARDDLAGSCAVTDANCLTTYNDIANDATARWGTWSGTQADCDAKARAIGAFVDASHPATCANLANYSGANCPNGATCSKTPTAWDPSAKARVSGNFTADPACQTKRDTLADVDKSQAAVCTLVPGTTSYSIKTANKPNVTIGTARQDCVNYVVNVLKVTNFFDDSNLSCTPGTGSSNASKVLPFRTGFPSGALEVASSAACSATVRAELVRLLGATDASITACKLSAVNLGSVQTVDAVAGKTCQDLVQNTDARRDGQGSDTLIPEKKTLVAGEQVTCATKCSESGTGVCVATAGVTVTPTMTIREYLTAANGATSCSSALTRATKVAGSDFAKVPADKAENSCPDPIQYAKIGQPYRITSTETDFVAGTKVDGGKQVPAMDLVSYIEKRSQELFGSNTPITSFFIQESGAARGLKYEAMAAKINGQVEDVKSTDYSSALVSLSDEIKERMERRFAVPKMTSVQTVYRVWLNGAELTSGWSASGSAVTLDKQIAIKPGDKLKFEYY